MVAILRSDLDETLDKLAAAGVRRDDVTVAAADVWVLAPILVELRLLSSPLLVATGGDVEVLAGGRTVNADVIVEETTVAAVDKCCSGVELDDEDVDGDIDAVDADVIAVDDDVEIGVVFKVSESTVEIGDSLTVVTDVESVVGVVENVVGDVE